MRRSTDQAGRLVINRVEVLVVLLVLGGLAAMLIPAVNGAREAAKKSKCSSYLKMIGLAFLQYETQFQSFPCGARVRTDPKTDEWVGDWGPSWWWEIMPFSYGSPVDSRSGLPLEPSYLMMSTDARRLTVNNFLPSFMHCPSSPLIESITLPNPQQLTATSITLPLPTYAAISGTVPDIAAIPFTPNWQIDWQPNVPSWNNPPQGASPRCTQQSVPEGTLGGNGVFPPNQWITIPQIRDGASNTILVGEQSDYGIDAKNENRKLDIRSCSWYGAWVGLGNTGGKNIKTIDPTLPGTITAYNCTTIAFPINSKIIQSTSSPQQSQFTVPGLVGIDLNQVPPAQPSGLGNNNGIQSAHAGGASVLFADNSVKFLSENMDFRILLYISCRDDQRKFPAP